MTDQRFPAQSPDSGKEFLEATTFKGDPGDPGRVILASPPFIAIPCDDDDSNPVFTNAESFFYIIDGNQIIADNATPDGWSVSVESQTDCTVGLTGNLGIAVSAITADTAECVIKASKAAENDLYARIYIKRINKGEKGDQGDKGVKGDTGSPGSTGAAGSDGTGVVVEKFVVECRASVPGDATNYGDDKIRLDFDSAHGFVVGEYLLVLDAAPAEAVILEVISSTAVKIDKGYLADVNDIPIYSMRHFRSIADGVGQILRFDNVWAVGDKPWELFLIMDDEDAGEDLTCSAGYAQYPASGYNYFINSKVYNSAEDIDGANLLDLSSAVVWKRPMVSATDPRKDVYLYGLPYPGNTWSADYSGVTFELHFVKFQFDIDFP